MLLLLFALFLASAQSAYYAILRLPSDSSSLPQYSAQFTQTQLTEQEVGWQCESGSNPISYTENSLPTAAKSIDLERGGGNVSCLGVVVRLVEGRPFLLWTGEGQQCEGYMTSTTSLRQTDSLARVEMKISPPSEFQVYSVPPSEACAARDPQYLDPPRVSFTQNGSRPTACRVQAERPELLSCNMSILAGTGEVIAMATRAKAIPVPQFVGRSRLASVECRCECRIREDLEGSRTVERDVVLLNLSSELSTATPEMHLNSAPAEEGTTAGWLLVLLCVISVLLFLSLLISAVLCHVSRSLRRRLRYAERNKASYRAAIPEVAPPPPPPSKNYGHTAPAGYLMNSQYSTLHDFRPGCNQCTHYNTVSLRLSECMDEPGDGRAIYQKLDFFRDNNSINNDSQATSV